MTTTLQRLFTFRVYAFKYLTVHSEKTKFAYALNRMTSRTETIAKEYNEWREDKLVELASVDEKGNLIKNDKGEYSFTPANTTAFAKAHREKVMEKVEVKEYMATEIPDLEFNEEEAFAGFVIPEIEEDKP